MTTGGAHFDARIRRRSLGRAAHCAADAGAKDVCAPGPGGDAAALAAGKPERLRAERCASQAESAAQAMLNGDRVAAAPGATGPAREHLPMPPLMLLAAVLLMASAAQAAEPPRAPVDADYRTVDMAQVRLGRLLFYDPILSGNRNIACATCHHPRFATSDGLSLGLGEGGVGIGPGRVVDPANPPERRIPRNAPALFNLGAREFTAMFHDGRLEADPSRSSGLRTPLEDDMVAGFASVLSAQTMFPVLSPDEMAGHYAENEVSRAVRQGLITGPGGAWDLLAGRVAAIPAYAEGFAAAFPELAAGRPIAFADISDAIAAFMEHEWRSDDAPFDRHLRGTAPLPQDAAAGMALFYGRAGCGGCHSGPFLTDHRFHAMGAPQLGPGKAERFESHQRDMGRMRVTGRPEDAYAFRTPSLRNVARTGPWGHAGGHVALRAFVRDHAEPRAGLARYAASAVLPAFDAQQPDWAAMEDRAEIAAAVDWGGVALTGAEIDALMALLDALTDPAAIAGRLGAPDSVPSSLPVPR